MSSRQLDGPRRVHRRWRPALLCGLVFACTAGAIQAQSGPIVIAPDGAWNWCSESRAVFHQGMLYVGYVRNADGRTVLSAFDPSTGARTDLWTSTLRQRDDHNNPGLLVQPDGTLLAIYARHGVDQFFSYRRSTSADPVSPADWTAEASSPRTGARVTYSNPCQLAAEPGRVYNFTRDLNFNPTLLTSTNGGLTWSAPQLFIRSGSGRVRPYVALCSDGVERIDFIYTDGHPRNVANSLYHLYYLDGAFHRTDGTLLTASPDLPIEHDLGERGLVIYEYSVALPADPNDHLPAGRAWGWEIVRPADGRPVCVFTVQRDRVAGKKWSDDRIYYYYARWTGTNWQKRFIAHAGRPLYSAEDDYAGGICLDPQNPGVVYLSSNALRPFDVADTENVPLRDGNRYELFRGVTTDGGLTFEWEPVTTNSAVDNLRPYVPRGRSGEPALLWYRGKYTSYRRYHCEIVGLFPAP